MWAIQHEHSWGLLQTIHFAIITKSWLHAPLGHIWALEYEQSWGLLQTTMLFPSDLYGPAHHHPLIHSMNALSRQALC